MMNVFEGVPRLQRRFQLIGVTPAVGFVAAAAMRLIVMKDPPAMAQLVLAMVLGGAWCLVWHRLVRERARRVVVRTRGMCCTHCGYSMVSLGDGGECPECGKTYYAQLAQRSWSRAAGMPFEE